MEAGLHNPDPDGSEQSSPPEVASVTPWSIYSKGILGWGVGGLVEVIQQNIENIFIINIPKWGLGG